MFCRAGNKYTWARKVQGPTSFSERGLFFSEISLTVQIKEKKSPLKEKEEAESFSIVLGSTDTFFLPLKRHDPNQKSMK